MIRRLLHHFQANLRAKNGRTHQRYQPQLECLESRWVPAGNVTATLLAPNFLFLEGDSLDNQVQIKGGKDVGELTVQGAQGTSIGGAAKQLFSGIDRISLVLREGDDTARISNLSMTNVNSAASLSLTGMTIWGGDGDDDIKISNVSILADGQNDAQAFITVRGDSFPGLSGSDNILVTNVTLESIGTVRTWAQVDVFGDTNSGVGGNDVATVKNASLLAHGGSVSNRAHISVQELTGGGNDTYSVLNSNVVASGPGASSRVTIEMGDGDDMATVRGSTFGRLQARLGSGSDKLVLRNNDIGILAFLDGQDDDDTLISKNNTGTINAVNFES